MRPSRHKRGEGFYSFLFLALWLLFAPTLLAEFAESETEDRYTEDYEDESARELNRALEDLRSQQETLTEEIQARALKGGLHPGQVLQLLEEMRQNPGRAGEMANEVLKAHKEGAADGGGALQKQMRTVLSFYDNYSVDELTQLLTESFNSGRYGKPLLKLFPWSPRFLASWIKDEKATTKAVELGTKRELLIIFGALNLMIIIANWVWKRVIRRRELGMVGHLKRCGMIWSARLALFYFMLWPYLGKTIEIFIHHVRFS